MTTRPDPRTAHPVVTTTHRHLVRWLEQVDITDVTARLVPLTWDGEAGAIELTGAGTRTEAVARFARDARDETWEVTSAPDDYRDAIVMARLTSGDALTLMQGLCMGMTQE